MIYTIYKVMSNITHIVAIHVDPVIQTTITWPTGTYGLPMTNSLSGCPNSAFYWMTGRRYQDTEDLFPSNEWSNPCHLLGPYAKNNMQQNFCIKTQYTYNVYTHAIHISSSQNNALKNSKHRLFLFAQTRFYNP